MVRCSRGLVSVFRMASVLTASSRWAPVLSFLWPKAWLNYTLTTLDDTAGTTPLNVCGLYPLSVGPKVCVTLCFEVITRVNNPAKLLSTGRVYWS